MRNTMIATLLILILVSNVDSAAKEGDTIEIEAEGSYLMEADSSVDLAREVALFTAKRNAVNLAARYLSHKSLIKTYGLNRDEILDGVDAWGPMALAGGRLLLRDSRRLVCVDLRERR